MKWNFVIVLATRFNRLLLELNKILTGLNVITPTLIAGMIIVTSSMAFANESPNSKMLLNDIIALEHLEILTPLRGEQFAQGYFYLWNGTAKSIYLNKITNQSGQEITLQRLYKQNGTQQWQNVSMPKTIPSRSELAAETGLFRFRVGTKELQNLDSQKLPMVFQFLDSLPIKMDAIVLPLGVNPTHHHHGFADSD